jgi:hypothetical protein
MASRVEHPAARIDELVLKAVGDEVLVYDLARHRAHSLNPVAAAIWRCCDGTRSLAGIAAEVRRADGFSITEDAVRYALAELGRARLLRAPVAEAALTRRDLVKRLGTAAAVALPLVVSIAPPTAAQIISCRTPGEACISNDECCGGQCTTGCLCQGGVCVLV